MTKAPSTPRDGSGAPATRPRSRRTPASTHRITALAALGGVAIAAAFASSGEAAPTDAGPAPVSSFASPSAAPRATGPERVRALALLATGAGEAASRAAACADGGADPEGCLDDVAESDDAARAAAQVLFPMLVTPGSYGFEEMSLRVVAKTAEGAPVYGIHGACAASTAAAVKPWWRLTTTVLVCPDSYAPGRVFDRTTHARCGSIEGRPPYSSDCGCGTNLLYCAQSGAHAAEMLAGWVAEVRDTIASAVTADRPLKDVFTMNETVRNANVEVRYRRARIANGEDAETVLAEPLWRGAESHPRVDISPGQQAGILTTPQALYRESGFRERIQLYSKMLWCIEPASAQVATSAVFDLGTADFRSGKGWESLVARPVCNDCHARLDYGLQFFAGYSWAPKTADYLLSERDLPTSFVYINGPDDLRGKGDATPLAFATIAVEQPEFGRCMAARVVDRVLGDTATTADVAAVRKAYADDGTYRAMLRAALRARLAQVPGAPHPVPRGAREAERAGGEPWETPDVEVDVSPALRKLVDRECITCHDDGERDFRGQRFTMQRVVRMINRVSARSMPPGTAALSAESRQAIVEALIDMLPLGAAEKARVRDYHLGADEAPRMEPDSVLLDTIAWRAGPKVQLGGMVGVPPPGLLSLGTDGESRLTAGEVMAIGVSAIKACQRANGDGSCVARAMAARGLTYDSQ